MILIFLIWSLIFFLFLILGFSVVKVISRISGQERSRVDRPIDEYFFIGFFVTSIFTGFISIWIPIDNKILLFVFLISFVLFIINFKEIRNRLYRLVSNLVLLKRYEKITIALIILFLLTLIVQKITLWDTGLYHAQCIQWIRKYAVVPGLGNIHGRLALNSMFLVISSLFTIQIKDVLIFPLNGICFLVLVLKLYSLFIIEFAGTIKWKAVFYITLIIMCLHIMIPLVNSTSPDIICGILIIYTFIQLTTQTEGNEKINYVRTILLALVVFSCITYKISSVFLVLMLLINLKNNLVKKSLLLFFIGILIFTPYLIRNYYLSGYLLYPFPSIDIFNVDWKIPYDKAIYEKDWIVSWARIPGLPYIEVLKMNFSEWLLPWLKANNSNNKILLVVNSLSVFTFVVMIIRKDYFYAKIQFIILLNLIFWFEMAPDVRFAYGFLLTGFSLTIGYIIMLIERSNPAGLLKFLKIAIPCFFIIIVGRRISNPIKIFKQPSLCIISAPYDKVETKALKSDFNYNIPVTEDRCFYSEIPCVPFPLDNVKLRGENLKDGFRILK